MRLSAIPVALVLTCLRTSPVDSAEPAKAFMLTQSAGFVHSTVDRKPKDRPPVSLAPAEIAMKQLGQQSRLFEIDCSQNAAADFTKSNLQHYKVVVFYTSGNLPIAPADMDYFLQEWLTTKGHGFIGIHSALDTFADYEPYWDMVGGTFIGHPWGADQTVTISVHDTAHPAMMPFGTEFTIKDEIYLYRHWQPEKVRVLMSLNLGKCAIKGARRKISQDGKEFEVVEAGHVPVSWVKNYGDGRVFVTNLGHNESTWVDKRFLDHLTGGMKWVLGIEQGDATPNPDVSKREESKARKDAGLTD